MIMPDDNMDELIFHSEAGGACEEALDFFRSCQTRSLTIQQMVEEGSQLDLGQEWALWGRMNLWDQLHPTTCILFSGLASWNEPRLAAHIQFSAKSVLPVEQSFLQSRWNPDEFPNLARRL